MANLCRPPRAIAALIALIISAQSTIILAASTRAGGGRDPLITKEATAPLDWSKEVVDSTMKRYPTAESLKGWGYAKSLYLYGEYLVYLRTNDKHYLQHVKDWIDLHVDEKGTINRPVTALDYMLPGNLCLILYKETRVAKYKGCADSIRKTFDTYPRTKD